jgi:hypothetical protein
MKSAEKFPTDEFLDALLFRDTTRIYHNKHSLFAQEVKVISYIFIIILFSHFHNTHKIYRILVMQVNIVYYLLYFFNTQTLINNLLNAYSLKMVI